MERRAGLKKQSLKTYLKGHEPPRQVLIAIARAASVSIEWLASGEEQRTAALAPGIDKHQLAISVKEVLEVLDAEDRETNAETVAEIVVDYYIEWERDGRQPSRKRLLSLVRRTR